MKISLFNRRQFFLRLFGLWLLTNVLVLGWIGINIFIQVTPIWLDEIFGIGVIFAIVRLFPEMPKKWLNNGIVQTFSWLLAVLGALVAFLWWDVRNLPTWGYVFIIPLTQFNSYIAKILSGEIVLSIFRLLELTAISQILVITALMLSVAGQIIWHLFLPFLEGRFRYFQRKFTWLTFRKGRIRLWTQWTFIAILFFFTSGIFSLVVANETTARLPDLKYITAPDILPSVPILTISADKTLYAGTNGGVFRSEDGGQSWTAASVGLTDTTILTLLATPDGRVYAGTNGGGVFRSEDGGQSWTAASVGLTYSTIQTLLATPDGRVYAGTNGGGVFRSEDGGQSWTAASVGLTDTTILTLLATLDGRVYAGTNGGGVFRSEDGGQSWTAASVGLPETAIHTLLATPDGRVYALTNGGVFRSEGGGWSWTFASVGLPDTYIQTLLATPGGRLYAGTYGDGVFRSVDGGQSWESVGLPETDIRTLLATPDGRLYAGTYGDGVFRSEDGGQSWTAASVGLTYTAIRALLATPDGMVYAGTNGGGVFRSEDGGQSWTAASVGLTDTAIHTLLATPDGRVYAGTNGGVFRSEDGGQSWTAASAGLPETAIHTLLATPDGRVYAGTNGGGVFRSEDGGQSWTAASVGLTYSAILTLLATPDGRVYAGTNGGGVFRSEDGGQSWESVGLPETDIRTLLATPDGRVYAGTNGGGVFRSEDGGQSWTAASVGLPETAIHTLLATPDGRVYAGTNGGGVFRSEDGGQSWTAASVGLTYSTIQTLLATPDGRVYAGTNGGGVFRSEDGGQSWTAASVGLTDTAIQTLLATPDGRVYAGTSRDGVFRSEDGGQSWTAASVGLTNTAIQTLLATPDGRVYAGTNGGGVFRSEDGGQSWESVGLTYSAILTLLATPDGRVYAGTYGGGVFCSEDGGQSWESVGLTNKYVVDLLADPVGTLYAKTDNFETSPEGVYRLLDDGKSWEVVDLSRFSYSFLDFFDTSILKGRVFHLSEETFIWSGSKHDPTWKFKLDDPSIIQGQTWSLNSGKTLLLGAWGATILIAELPENYPQVPMFWVTLRAMVVYQMLPWLQANAKWLIALLVIVLLINSTGSYLRVARPLGIPALNYLFAGSQLPIYPSPEKLMSFTQAWERVVYSELIQYGDVTLADLLPVPRAFRGLVLEQYTSRNQDTQALQKKLSHLRLLNQDRLKNWRTLWSQTTNELAEQPGLPGQAIPSVNQLAQTFAQTLGFHLSQANQFGLGMAYLVNAPSIRLKLPPQFSLFFLTDPHPDADTVRTIYNAIKALELTSYLALIIPLEPENPQTDIPFALRRAIKSVPFAHDFVVIDKNEAMNILIARHPDRALALIIGKQVDLTVISPFIVNGPVPVNMFFGRDEEIRLLAENLYRRDYAIVGNRKIGKTSLLNRLEYRLQDDENIRLIKLDCQAIREAEAFYSFFEEKTGISLITYTPQGLAGAIRELHRSGPSPVFLLDETDALLNHEKDSKEPLVTIWRELATEGSCRFIFCGTASLARRLRDAESAMFNFAEPLPMTYLSRKETEEIIAQPLETLGIVIENQEELLNEVWKLSSGHPNLTQYIGKTLVEAANTREERQVKVENIELLHTDSRFLDFFFDTVWGAASPLEKLITLVAPNEGFRVDEVEKNLLANGIAFTPGQLDDALQMLETYAILRRYERKYTFVPEAFPALLQRNMEVERLIAAEKRKWIGEKT